MTSFSVAGIGVWQGALLASSHVGNPISLQLADEITVVVTADVGVEAGKAEALKQMRLPEIAEIVIDAAASFQRDIDQTLLASTARQTDADRQSSGISFRFRHFAARGSA